MDDKQSLSSEASVIMDEIYEMNEIGDKGSFKCRCECCIYWRRHVHRVSANADGRSHRNDHKLLAARALERLYKGWYEKNAVVVQRLRKELTEVIAGAAQDRHRFNMTIEKLPKWAKKLFGLVV